MNFSFSLTLEIILALLLVVMIWYSVILNRRLTRFRGNREQMEKLAATFNDATTRATSSIGDLRIASDALQDQLAKAESLRDDLVFLVDRGTIAADRLEENVRIARDEYVAGGDAETADPLEAVEPVRQQRPAPKVAAARGARNADAGDPAPSVGGKKTTPRSEAERALLKAIRSAN
ncbi:MAG TPA: hypothetical protein DIW51_12560 [Rhodospirillaceae bacterium]|nr:hypothetical protein [Magnetovibrio sp.]HBT43935.1 hypothetical protein [Rhodospirillaceae bacterium]HCS70785.1 hypothetical protein [Rhodospirillaceae bacterium]